MRKLALVAVCITVCFFLGGCDMDEGGGGGGGGGATGGGATGGAGGTTAKPTADSFLQQMVAKSKEMNGILVSIKDAGSARAAAPKILAMKDDLKKLIKQAEALPEPTTQQANSPEYKQMREYDRANKQEIERIKKDPQLEPAAKALEELKKAIE